jgi:transposase
MTCTKQQVALLLKYAATCSQEVAAARAGVSLSTAKRYLKTKGKREVKQPEDRNWRTRSDPFAEVWDELKGMLQRDHGLQSQTLMSWLIESYPDKFEPGQVRTLRRRIRDWRVLEGPERKEVMFAQTIHAGRQSQSDWTHCKELKVTLGGEPFPHLVYHFMLPYSRWEFVWICHTESFETLTTGYSLAVSALGAVAPEHRTDNLAAAVPIGGHGEFQIKWTDFLQHYGFKPSANNPGKSNENGAVEKSNDLFKNSVDQRLRIRGHRDFRDQADYESFLAEAVVERNRLRHARVQEELAVLKALPQNQWYEPKQHDCTVSAWSTVSMSGAVYSVPSRFIGQKLKGLVHGQTVSVYFGRHVVLTCPSKSPGGREINYRHLIFHLLRKPGAFRNYQYREELFPRLVFRKAYDALRSIDDERADKEYLKILNMAALDGEDDVASALELLLECNEIPRSERVRSLCKKAIPVPVVAVLMPRLSDYDKLLKNPTNLELT